MHVVTDLYTAISLRYSLHYCISAISLARMHSDVLIKFIMVINLNLQ